MLNIDIFLKNTFTTEHNLRGTVNEFARSDKFRFRFHQNVSVDIKC